MIVPQFWAEARIQSRVGRRSITVKRFGWSDASPQDAQAMADARAREAFDRIASGQPLVRREPNVPYNGAEGVPIREEVIRRHGETVITRNSYGALCLNSPNVLFVDVDFHSQPAARFYCAVIALGLLIACVIAWSRDSLRLGIILVGSVLVITGPIVHIVHGVIAKLAGSDERRIRARIEQFLERNPEWYFRLYRTPAGFRILVMHRTFDPGEVEVMVCFDALHADPMYVRMCRNQRCFRARLSPKPWRIGIGRHIVPRRGKWPVDPMRLPERTEWIAAYDETARGYASCRFVEAFGSGVVHSAAHAVQKLHDELSRAEQDLPLA